MPDPTASSHSASPLPDIYRALGEVLRETRERADRTQAEVAKAAKLTRTSLTNIERGRQRLMVDTFVEIALFLGTSGSELLAEVEHKAKPKRLEAPIVVKLPEGVSKNASSEIAGIIATAKERSSHATPPTALSRKGRVPAR